MLGMYGTVDDYGASKLLHGTRRCGQRGRHAVCHARRNSWNVAVLFSGRTPGPGARSRLFSSKYSPPTMNRGSTNNYLSRNNYWWHQNRTCFFLDLDWVWTDNCGCSKSLWENYTGSTYIIHVTWGYGWFVCMAGERCYECLGPLSTEDTCCLAFDRPYRPYHPYCFNCSICSTFV